MIPDQCCVGRSFNLHCVSVFPLDSSVFSILQFLGDFLHRFPDENGPSSPIRYTSVFSHVELDLPKDWLALVVTRVMRILLWSEFSANNSLSSSSLKMFSEISSIRIEFSEGLKRMTPNIVPSTFL